MCGKMVCFKLNILLLLIIYENTITSHTFDGYPTFALTDHTLEFSCRQTPFYLRPQYFSNISTHKTS